MQTRMRIIPNAADGDFTITNGTKVVTPEGVELPHVTRVTLHCESNDVWRATIECIIDPPNVTVLADVREMRYAGNRWQRFCSWLVFGSARRLVDSAH